MWRFSDKFSFFNYCFCLSLTSFLLIQLSPIPLWAYEMSLGPSFNLEEPKKGSFVLERSWIAAQEDVGPDLKLFLGLGSEDLSKPAIWFKQETSQALGLQSFFVESKSSWLDLRFGFIPIAQSFEGSLDENEFFMPDTRVRRQNWFVRRDFGFELRSHFNEWLGRWAFHNGESKPDRDSQIWFTGLWQYKNSEGVGIQLTTFVGRTAASETAQVVSGANTLGFIFDPQANAKIRHAAISFFKMWNHNLVLAEMGRGEVMQNQEKQSFVWGHFDLCYDLGNEMNFLTRYEHTQPDGRESASTTKSFGIGFQWWVSGGALPPAGPRSQLRGFDGEARWQIWAQKNAQKTDIPDDQIQLSYSFYSPSF